MATITSAANGNASASSTWVGGVVPGIDDDVIIGGHSITLDADMVWNSLTMNNASARLTPSGTTRSLTITNQWLVSANLSADGVNIPGGCHFTVTVGFLDTTTNQTNQLFRAGFSGAHLTLTGHNGAESDLVDVNGLSTWSLLELAHAAATVNTIGRFFANIGSGVLMTMNGGVWNHTHVGLSRWGNNAASKVLNLTGNNPSTVQINGDWENIGAVSSTGVVAVSNGNAIVNLNGNWLQSLAGGAGALLYVSAGIIELTGKASHLAGTNTLTVWMIGGIFRWQNQSHTINSDEAFTLYATGGNLVLNDLLLENYNRVVGVLSGAAMFSTTGFTITNQPGAIAGFNFIDVIIVDTPDPAPTLPDPGDVAAGVSYGYTAAPIVGTGLLLNPATLAAAMAGTEVQANVVKISDDSSAADALESMLDGTGGAQLTLRNLLIDSIGTPGTIAIEVRTSDAYPFAMWDASFNANVEGGLLYNAEEGGIFFPSQGFISADIIGNLQGDLSGKVLGGGGGTITGTGVQSTLASDSIGASQIVNGSLTANKFSGVFPSNFPALGINASGHISRVTTTDVASNMITQANVRTAVGLAAANLDTQLGGIVTSIASVSQDTGTDLPSQLNGLEAQIVSLATITQSILDDTGTTLPAQIAGLETGGATPNEIWDYFLTLSGDPSAEKIAQAVAAQSVFTPFQVAVGSVGVDAIQDYAINDNAVTKIAAGVWQLLIGGAEAQTYLARIDEAISTRLSATGYVASLPDNFADLSITATDGFVTPTNTSVGSFAVRIHCQDQNNESVKGVRLWFTGSADQVYTDAFGDAQLYADPGTFELRIDVPSAYLAVAPLTLEVIDQDLQITIDMERISATNPPPLGMCLVTLHVVDQTGLPVIGATVQHRIVPGYAVIEDQWLVNAAPSTVTNSAGTAEVLAARDQVYDFTVMIADNHRVTIRRKTPDLPAASLSMMIEV